MIISLLLMGAALGHGGKPEEPLNCRFPNDFKFSVVSIQYTANRAYPHILNIALSEKTPDGTPIWFRLPRPDDRDADAWPKYAADVAAFTSIANQSVLLASKGIRYWVVEPKVQIGADSKPVGKGLQDDPYYLEELSLGRLAPDDCPMHGK